MTANTTVPRQTLVISEAYDVGVALRDYLGLSRAVFVSAVLEGDRERKMTTVDDSPGAPGYYQYTRTLRVLRVEARQLEWHNGLFLRIPATLNLDESIALTVSSGDGDTGRPDGNPQTRNEKGEDAMKIVGANKLPFGQMADDEGGFGVDFWYLLYASDETGVWAEVSRPRVMLDGRVTEWDVRIVLGQVDAGQPLRRVRAGEASPAIDVPVRRKKAS